MVGAPWLDTAFDVITRRDSTPIFDPIISGRDNEVKDDENTDSAKHAPATPRGPAMQDSVCEDREGVDAPGGPS